LASSRNHETKNRGYGRSELRDVTAERALESSYSVG
jgi:hypothetical protein